MAEKQSLIDKYNAHLEHFLKRVKEEVDQTIPPLSQGSINWEETDKYICQLNTFYYQSFGRHFMPVYRQYIQQSVTDAYNLSRTQSMVKKDIMAVIKRYAGLYNKVKTFSNLLLASRQQVEAGRVTLDRNQKLLILQLSDGLEQLLNNLQLCHKMITTIVSLRSNTAYTNAITSSGAAREMSRIWSLIEFDNARMANESDQLYQTLHLMVMLTAEFSSLSSLEDGHNILSSLKELINKLSHIRTPLLKSWFDQSLRPFLFCKAELIEVYLQHQQLTEAAAAACGLEQWLEPLVTVIKQLQSLQSEVIPEIHPEGREITLEVLQRLEQKLADSVQNIKELLTNLISPALNDDRDGIFNKLNALLQSDYDYYSAFSQDGTYISLHNLLNRICLQLYIINSGLDAGREQQRVGRQLSAYYQDISGWVDKYCGYLNNISSDLERLLTPRNLNRIWKGMDIRVEHVVLQTGNQFPSQYTHLLDQHQVETRLSDRDQIILHEEGDLFIIKVDELAEEEMPYMIISMKG